MVGTILNLIGTALCLSKTWTGYLERVIELPIFLFLIFAVVPACGQVYIPNISNWYDIQVAKPNILNIFIGSEEERT